MLNDAFRDLSLREKWEDTFHALHYLHISFEAIKPFQLKKRR
jgi:hypothetical protein